MSTKQWDDHRRLRNKVSTMTKKAKADYYSNLFDEVKTAAAYWRLLKKASGTTKVNRQARQLKKDDGTLTSNDTEKANTLNAYFCTVAEKLIGPVDEIQPLHADSSEIANVLTITCIIWWPIGPKHFPESKNTSQNPKHFPESNTVFGLVTKEDEYFAPFVQ